MRSPASRWLVGTGMPAARLRLYCFSHAGGSAHAYATWQAALGPDVDVRAVQLPGRGARMHETPFTSLSDLVAAVVDELVLQPDLPFAFFGHSMGAIVAFETVRLCARRGLQLPQLLIVSGATAPRYRTTPRPLHLLPDDELIAQLQDYGGTPPEVLKHAELMTLLLPMIRADFGLLAEYVYRGAPLLAMPISVLVGSDDSPATLEHADKWQEETTGPCAVKVFDGGHFFVQSHAEAVLACVHRSLLRVLEPSVVAG